MPLTGWNRKHFPRVRNHSNQETFIALKSIKPIIEKKKFERLEQHTGKNTILDHE